MRRSFLGVLLGLLVGLVALELGFIAGQKLNKPELMTICLSLIVLLTFAACAYLVIAGIASYSQELREKCGYLVFMAPVQPVSIVASKLLFIALMALAATALFGTAGYLDFRFSDLNWRKHHPNLQRLQEKLAARPSFQNTQPPAA